MTNLHWRRDLINSFSHAQGGTVAAMVALVPLCILLFWECHISAQCCHAMNKRGTPKIGWDVGRDRNRVVGG